MSRLRHAAPVETIALPRIITERCQIRVILGCTEHDVIAGAAWRGRARDPTKSIFDVGDGGGGEAGAVRGDRTGRDRGGRVLMAVTGAPSISSRCVVPHRTHVRPSVHSRPSCVMEIDSTFGSVSVAAGV